MKGFDIMYTIDILEYDKIIHIVTNKLIKEPEGIEIFEKLKQVFQEHNTSNYYMVLDTGGYKPSMQKDIKILHDVLQLYITTPFIKKYLISPSNMIAKAQANRVSKLKFKEYFVEVKSFEEALKLIKELH